MSNVTLNIVSAVAAVLLTLSGFAAITDVPPQDAPVVLVA